MVGWIKGLFSPRPMRRWSLEELAEKKRYLENLHSELFTDDDWLLVVDYLFQRYLPQSATLTERKYRKVLDKIRLKIQANLRGMKSVDVSLQCMPAWFSEVAERLRTDDKFLDREWVAEQDAKIKREHELSTHGISMDVNEFSKIIIPNLLRYPQSSIGYDATDAALLYAHSGEREYRPQRDIYDQLCWRHHDVIIQASTLLRRNYERLRGAVALGWNVKIFACKQGCCLGVLNECTVDASKMLEAYTNTDSPYPLLPPPETPCLEMDGAFRVCDLAIMSSPTFEEETLPENWREALVEKRNSILQQRLDFEKEQLEGLGESIRSISASMGDTPDIQSISHIGIKELRNLQKKYGLRGHRKMVDIAGQLLSCDSAANELIQISETWRAQQLERAKNEAKSCFEYITWIKETIGNSAKST